MSILCVIQEQELLTLKAGRDKLFGKKMAAVTLSLNASVLVGLLHVDSELGHVAHFGS